MSDTTITTRRVTLNPRTSQLAYVPITALPNGESATTESTVPSNPTASSPRYINVGSQYYELKGKKPTADNIMFGEIAVAFPSGYERLYIKNSDTDIVEFAPDVDFKVYNASGTDAEGNTITSLSVQQVANHIRLGYTVGNSLMMGEIITRTNTTPTSSDTFVAGNAYIYTQPLTEATFSIVSLVGVEDATTQETNIYFKVDSDEVVIDVHETNTDASEHAALVHIGNYTSITQGVRYTGFADGKWYVITIRDNTVSCHTLDILVDVSGTGNVVTGITADGNKLTVSKGSVTANAAITSNNATTIGTITTPSGTTTLKSNTYALVQSGSDTIGLSVNGTDTAFYTINNVAHATRADRMKLFSYTDVIYPTGLDIDSTISANAIHVNDEVESAIHKVDTKLSATISSMVDFEELMVSVGESIRYNVGLEPDYSYVNKPDPNVIVGATNIKEAIFMLDNAIGNVSVTPILTSGDSIATINVNDTAYTLKSNAYTLTSTAATNGSTLHFKKNGSSSDQSTITVYDKQVKQNPTTENNDISLLLRGTSTDANASEVKYATGLKYNPSTNVLESGSFKKTGGTSSQFLMADGSTMQYRVWDIINSVYAITVNSSLTQNSSAPSASSSTDTVAPGETLLFERALTSLTVDLTNVTGTNASPYEASIHFMAGDGLTYITLTGDHASFHYGSYAAGTSSYTGKFDNLQIGARYCLSIKDGAVICGPSEAGGGGNADAPIVHVVTNTSATALSLPDTGTDYELLPNNSYVYTVPLTSLSIDLANITGSTTNTDKYSGYSCIVYFQTGENMSTFTVSNNNATYTFGTYTNSGTTYTFNVSPSTAYVFTVKDNVVSVGPLNEEIILSTLETIRENVGLDPYYMYVNKPQPVVIDNATDLVAAVFMLDDAFGGVYTSIDSLGTDIALLSGTIDTMENALDTLGTTVLQLGTDVKALNTRVNNIGTDVTNLKTSVARMGTDINIIYSTLTDMGTDISHKRDKGKFIYNTSATSATITMAYNTSYVYANANGLTSLTVNMGTVTSTPTVGTDNYSDRTYESTVFFMAHDNATTLTLNSCYATCVFGEYTKSGTTYTFNNFIANIWYCLSVKDNSVVCGPVRESPITTQTDLGTGSYLVTGISATDHTILYKKLAFENDTNKYLRSDGQWQPVQGSSGGTVTSVGLQMPSMYSIKTNGGTYAPINTSGTFIVDFNSQTKNYVLAAPSTANGKPSFRALTATDIPQLSYNTLTDKPTPPVDTNQTVTTANCNFGADAAVRIQGTTNGNITVVGANNTSPNTITISAPNMVNDLTWSSANLKLQKTKNGTSTDVLTFVAGNYINISSTGKTITIGTAGKMITNSFETASGVTIIYSDSSSDHLTNGRSVTIKGSLPSTADLASKQSTAVAGDSYLIDGDLWVFTGTTQTDTHHQYGFENVGEIQGPQGDQGPQGVGIGSISKTDTQGLVDTYTVYSDESTPQSIGTFTVTNGSDGAPGADGATWYSGTSNPADSLGVVGDFYLKTSSTQQVILKKARSTGSNRWDTIATINNGSAYTLPKATSSSLGGVKIGYSESDSNYAVKLGTSTDMYVTVPWKNQKIHSGNTHFGTDADINITGTDGVSVYPNTSGSTLKIGLNAANTNTLGGIKAYATTSSTDLNTNTGGSQNYPVRMITGGTNANKAFVHVDWTDTRYKLTLNSNTKGTASSSTDLGGFYAPLSAGNSGDLLVSNGSGTGPSWFHTSTDGFIKKSGNAITVDRNTYLTSGDLKTLTLQLGGNTSTSYNTTAARTFNVPVFNGSMGLVPASTSADRTNGRVLNASGTWVNMSGGSSTDTWRDVYINGGTHVGTATTTKAVNFTGTDNISVTYQAAGTASGQSGNANYFNVLLKTPYEVWTFTLDDGSTVNKKVTAQASSN